MRRLVRSGAVLGVVGALLVTVACSSGKSNGEAANGGGSFTVGFPSAYLTHFVPGQAGDSGLDEAIYTGLTTLDPATGKVSNAVAKSMTSSDQKVWTITLNTDWKFQNGEPVTAQSFADSWNTTAYGPNAMGYGYLMSIIQGYTALNPAKGTPSVKTLSGVKVLSTYKLQVTLTQPLAVFPYVVSGTTFAPMAKASLADLKSADSLPIGDGPYSVAKPGIAPGVQQITLNRFDGYAGPKGHAKTIIVKSFQDTATAYTSFQAGAVDVTSVTGSQLTAAKGSYASQVVTADSPGLDYLGFPLWDKRFQDPRVREAFSLAIDRASIVKALLGGSGTAATGLAPSSLVGGGQADCSACAYDPARAKQLLEEAGGWHGSLILYTKQDPTTQAVLQAIMNQLRTNLGITSVSMQAQPLDQIYSNLGAHKLSGPFLLYMGASYPNVYSLVDDLFAVGSGTNVTSYSNSAVSNLITQASGASDLGSVTSYSQQASKAALADLPLAPVFYPQTGLVHAKNLSSVKIDFLGDPDLQDVIVH